MRIIYHLCLTDLGRPFFIPPWGKIKSALSQGVLYRKPKGMMARKRGSGGSLTQRIGAATEDPPKDLINAYEPDRRATAQREGIF